MTTLKDTSQSNIDEEEDYHSLREHSWSNTDWREEFMETPVMKRLLAAENLLMATGRLGEFFGKNIPDELDILISQLLEAEKKRIREEVLKLEYEENDADGNHSYDRARQNEGYNYAKADFLAVLQKLS